MTSLFGFGSLSYRKYQLLALVCLLSFVVDALVQSSTVESDDVISYALTSNGIVLPLECNSSQHTYPYLATVFTCGCILVVIIAIIVFGANL